MKSDEISAEIQKNHNLAMDLVEEAHYLQQKEKSHERQQLLSKAFKLEAQAARLVDRYVEACVAEGQEDVDPEPSRSMLCQSAATIAMQYDFLLGARQMSALGLAGDPPAEIEEELRQTLEAANFHHHLLAARRELSAQEMQLILTGDAVNHGMAPVDDLTTRSSALIGLARRTDARMRKRPFRSQGRIQSKCSGFMAVPEAASFAVVIRLVFDKDTVDQGSFPGMDYDELVIAEIARCLQMVAHEQYDELLLHMNGDQGYFNNFKSLSGTLFPDGSDVRTVAVVTSGRVGPCEIVLDRPRKPKELKLPKIEEQVNDETPQVVQITGVLSLAKTKGYKKSTDNTIGIVDDNGKTHDMICGEGLTDVVRLYFDKRVTVECIKVANILTMSEIY